MVILEWHMQQLTISHSVNYSKWALWQLTSADCFMVRLHLSVKWCWLSHLHISACPSNIVFVNVAAKYLLIPIYSSDFKSAYIATLHQGFYSACDSCLLTVSDYKSGLTTVLNSNREPISQTGVYCLVSVSWFHGSQWYNALWAFKVPFNIVRKM